MIPNVPAQTNFDPPIQPPVDSSCCCQVMRTAIIVIKFVGLLLAAAGIGCLIAGLQAPAIALLVAGAAALILGFTLPTSVDINVVPTPAMAFSRQEWIQLIGDPGAVESLPENIEEILASPCPFWEGKTVAETHMLVFIPKTVARVVFGVSETVPLTLKILDELVKASNNGIGFGDVWDEPLNEHGYTPVKKSHWVLMTRDILPGSRGLNFADQKRLVENTEGYSVPTCLDAAACILLEHLRSGIRLFGDDPYTYTRCLEMNRGRQVVVGGFEPRGLTSNSFSTAETEESYGIAAFRKL